MLQLWEVMYYGTSMCAHASHHPPPPTACCYFFPYHVFRRMVRGRRACADYLPCCVHEKSGAVGKRVLSNWVVLVTDEDVHTQDAYDQRWLQNAFCDLIFNTYVKSLFGAPRSYFRTAAPYGKVAATLARSTWRSSKPAQGSGVRVAWERAETLIAVVISIAPSLKSNHVSSPTLHTSQSGGKLQGRETLSIRGSLDRTDVEVLLMTVCNSPAPPPPLPSPRPPSSRLMLLSIYLAPSALYLARDVDEDEECHLLFCRPYVDSHYPYRPTCIRELVSAPPEIEVMQPLVSHVSHPRYAE